jgi:hypothetical protein
MQSGSSGTYPPPLDLVPKPMTKTSPSSPRVGSYEEAAHASYPLQGGYRFWRPKVCRADVELSDPHRRGSCSADATPLDTADFPWINPARRHRLRGCSMQRGDRRQPEPSRPYLSRVSGRPRGSARYGLGSPRRPRAASRPLFSQPTARRLTPAVAPPPAGGGSATAQ